MHDHFQEGDGGDADVFEVVWVAAPWVEVVDCFLLRGCVGVEGIAVGVCEVDGIVELWEEGLLVELSVAVGEC